MTNDQIPQSRAKPVIAIDGPAASGKGTLSRKLAEKLGFAHMDTGAVYRLAALTLLQKDLPLTLENGQDAARYILTHLTLDMLDDPALRSDEVSVLTSKLSAIPEVREILLDTQRQFALNPPHGFDGAVLDGRDIGTIVCPDADLKLYVVANAEIRAMRRLKELQNRGLSANYDAVLKDMKDRDFRDSNRDVAPLKPADDAEILDTSALTADQALEKALQIVNQKLGF